MIPIEAVKERRLDQVERQICDDCRLARREWTNPDNKDLYCGNLTSDNYGEVMGETKSCERWEKND